MDAIPGGWFIVDKNLFMNLFQAIVLGVIQGLTEFLPISSTAHLRVVPALLGWDDPGAGFSAVIQIGTVIAVFAYFWSDLMRLVPATLHSMAVRKIDSPDARLGWFIVLGSVPVVVCGLLLEKYIDQEFRSLYVIAGAAITLALVLWAAEGTIHWRQRKGEKLKDLDQLNWRDALAVGLAQALALIPGSSRSGVTITAGLFTGMSRPTAARFSFLLSLPSVFGAGIYKLYKDRHDLFSSQESLINLLVATVISGVVGYASIAFLVGYLKSHSTYLFIVYRLVLGALLLILLYRGVLSP
jgi:undecaprenyl-diphosphatase